MQTGYSNLCKAIEGATVSQEIKNQEFLASGHVLSISSSISLCFNL